MSLRKVGTSGTNGSVGGTGLLGSFPIASAASTDGVSSRRVHVVEKECDLAVDIHTFRK